MHELPLELVDFLGTGSRGNRHLSSHAHPRHVLDTRGVCAGLGHRAGFRRGGGGAAHRENSWAGASLRGLRRAVSLCAPAGANRSEERRVGKECVRPCSSRWSTSHHKKDINRITRDYVYTDNILYSSSDYI